MNKHALNKLVAQTIAKIGLLSTRELMGLISQVTASTMKSMSEDGFIRVKQREDGSEAWELTVPGKRMAGCDLDALGVARGRSNTVMKGEIYKPKELMQSSRPGANDHMKYPSLHNGEKTYRYAKT